MVVIDSGNIHKYSVKFYCVASSNDTFLKLSFSIGKNKKCVPELDFVLLLEQATLFPSIDAVIDAFKYLNSYNLLDINTINKSTLRTYTSFYTEVVNLKDILPTSFSNTIDLPKELVKDEVATSAIEEEEDTSENNIGV